MTARLALTISEACDELRVGRSFFYEHIYPELKTVRRGGRVLIARVELERWMDRNGAVKAP